MSESRYGTGGRVRWGAPAADATAHKTMADYRARTGQHWVRNGFGRMVLRPCRAPLGEACPQCDARAVPRCGRCAAAPEPCRKCARRHDSQLTDEHLARVQREELAQWLADPQRRLPPRWEHPVPPSDPMWRHDVRRTEHVVDGASVSSRRLRVGPCPPQRRCPQCAWGARLLFGR